MRLESREPPGTVPVTSCCVTTICLGVLGGGGFGLGGSTCGLTGLLGGATHTFYAFEALEAYIMISCE